MSITQTTTIPTCVTRIRDHARRDPDGIALRSKSLGIWEAISWKQYWESVELVGHGLLALGVHPGDRIGVHSENRPEWVLIDMGTMAVRGATMGLYPTNPATEVEYLLRDSGTKILFAEDQEQVDKALEADVGELEKIIVIEPRGTGGYEDPRLITWRDFLELAAKHKEANPSAVTDQMDQARGEDLAVLIYTSGTTGKPKGAMLTIENIEFAAKSAGSEAGLISPPPGPGDVLLSYLPLSHVYERLLTCWLSTQAGNTVFFAESIDTVATDLRQVQPTIFASVPRILEKVHSGVEVRMSVASRFKRLNFALWSKAAAKIGDHLAATGGVHSLGTRVLYGLGYPFLFRALKERMGLRRCRIAISGAAPISPEILRWFMGVGVPVVEAYGMTETTAIGTSNRLGDAQLGTVGKPLPGVELKLDPQTGEILLRHEGIFAGYWNRPEATAETLDSQGWLHTGDVGELADDQTLKIVDRIKDIIITAGGKNISPSEIENALKVSPFIKEAVVVGDRRKFLAALIGIDFDTVGAWAQAKRIPYTTYADLSQKPEVVALISGVIENTNQHFARVEGVKQFRLLAKELDHDTGELTATQKVKRSSVIEAFSGLVDDIYGAGA